MSDQPLDLEPIVARSHAATGGPWEADEHANIWAPGIVELRWKGAPPRARCVVGAGPAPVIPREADVDLIANAPTDIAALLAEVEAWRTVARQAISDLRLERGRGDVSFEEAVAQAYSQHDDPFGPLGREG